MVAAGWATRPEASLTSSARQLAWVLRASATAVAGWIRDGDTDSSVDIEALGLRLSAALGAGQLGAAVNAIETSVTLVSARVGAEGLNLLESDGLTVTDTTATIRRVAADSGTAPVTDTAQRPHIVGEM